MSVDTVAGLVRFRAGAARRYDQVLSDEEVDAVRRQLVEEGVLAGDPVRPGEPRQRPLR